MEAKEGIIRDREAHEAIQKKELEELTTWLEQRALVFKDNESGPTMNAHEFFKYEPEFDINDPYIPTKEENIGMLDEGDDASDNELIERVDNVQISDVMVDRIGFKDAENIVVTLKKLLEQRHTNVTPFI